MNELKEKAQAIVNKYAPTLAQRGLRISLTKRYYESAVGERSTSAEHGIVGIVFNSIERANDHKKEKEYGYNNQNNQYHLLILTLLPLGKGTLRQTDYREYAFTVKKIERPHPGEEPRHIVYSEEKILSRIEKRIQKILKKNKTSSPERICKNKLVDAFRYAMHPRYEYKERFLGKDHFTWEMIFKGIISLLFLAGFFIAWLITK